MPVIQTHFIRPRSLILISESQLHRNFTEVIAAVKMMWRRIKLCPKLLIYLLRTNFKAFIIYSYRGGKYPLFVYFGGNWDHAVICLVKYNL